MNKEAQDEVERQLNAAMEVMSLHELRRVHGLSQKIVAQTFGGGSRLPLSIPTNVQACTFLPYVFV